MPIIEVNDLRKYFYIKKKPKRLFEKIKYIFFRSKKKKHVLNGISFNVNEGDLLAFIGLNGAGKSTTIKILTGIYPASSGYVRVLSKEPFKNRREIMRDIGVVFGHRSLLEFNIAPRYSLELFAAIYGINKKETQKRIKKFSKMLKVEHLLDVPVRKLSLGETMKFNIIASIMHMPKLLFLDEPTIGLDLFSRKELISFLRDLNKKYNTTIFLTTHNMDDIEELCDRVIILDKKKIIYDGSLKDINKKYASWKRITVFYSKKKKNLSFKVIEKDDSKVVFKASNKNISEKINKILDAYEVKDIKIEDPPLKEVIAEIYMSDKK